MKKSRSKKHSSRNLTFPLLVFSSILTLGLGLVTLRALRPTPVPIGINEVAGTTACNSALISDNFDGASLDTAKWIPFLASETSTIAQSGGKLNMTSTPPSPSHTNNTGLASITQLEGNFIAEVTVSNLQSTPINDNSAELALGADGAWLTIAWRHNSTGNYVDMNSTTKVGATNINEGHFDVGSATSLKLRISRSRSMAYGYVDVGQGWQLVGIIKDAYSGKGGLQPIVFDFSKTAGNVASATFDNLKVSCPSAKPIISLSCKNNAPVGQVTWDGGDPDGAAGFIVNLFEVPWNGNYSNKTVGNVHATDGSGFVGTADSPQIKGQAFVLKSGKKYAANIWNGTHSPDADPFTVPSCVTVPTNPRMTCNPDGKSVRLMWDSVDGVGSYKVRLDDKAGHVTPYDNITKSEYVANITPNTTYTWWAHSSKDGVDSNETARQDFKCTPTTAAISTAAPTVKPTAKPTVKPTPEPTLSPTIAPSRAPTNPSYVAPDTDNRVASPVASAAPAKSTNPISRFFAWLAGLFE